MLKLIEHLLSISPCSECLNECNPHWAPRKWVSPLALLRNKETEEKSDCHTLVVHGGAWMQTQAPAPVAGDQLQHSAASL